MKLEDINTICDECARELGFIPKDKAVGVWMDNCDNCLKYRPCTNLWHDWRKENKNER